MRQNDGLSNGDTSKRPEGLRDRDRIFYSDAFRRLEGVTQVANVASFGIHNRMTHSLRVEQIGRSIYHYLQTVKDTQNVRDKHAIESLDENVIAAAGLAHDIGHAPFGHTGEKALQSLLTCSLHHSLEDRLKSDFLCKECLLPDSFEGNAQALRILAKVAVSSHWQPGEENHGLELTRRTMRAVVKYPWLRGKGSEKKAWDKFGAYDCDREILCWIFDGKSNEYSFEKSNEARIMDWADDIAYAVHDLEDFYRLGLIPLEELRIEDIHTTFSKATLRFFDYLCVEFPASDSNYDNSALHSLVKNYTDFMEHQKELQKKFQNGESSGEQKDGSRKLFSVENLNGPEFELLNKILQLFPEERFEGSADNISRIAALRTGIIGILISGIEIQNGEVIIDRPAELACEFLKQLSWFYVIDSDFMSQVRDGQVKIITTLFKELREQAKAAWSPDTATKWESKEYQSLPKGLQDILEIMDKSKEGAGTYDFVACLPDKADSNSEKARKASDRTKDAVIARAVVDYICTLTDEQAYTMYARMAGNSDASVIHVLGK
jgi:dGTPase